MSLFANCRWKFLLDRLGSCLTLFVSTGHSTSSHEFASQFCLALLIREKHSKTTTKIDLRASVCRSRSIVRERPAVTATT